MLEDIELKGRLWGRTLGLSQWAWSGGAGLRSRHSTYSRLSAASANNSVDREGVVVCGVCMGVGGGGV